MAEIPAVLPALAMLTGAECMLNIFLFPHILPGKPVTELFVLLMTINFSIWAFWKVFIYPYWFSPFRHYARPKGGLPLIYNGRAAVGQKPAGDSFRKFINEVPNEGIIRFPSFFNVDWLLLTNPSSLADVLVHKAYDFQKPGPVRKFLSIILGDGLIVVEDDLHKFQRKNAMPAFSFRHIKELYPIFWSKSVEMSQSIASEIHENHEPSPGEKPASLQGIVEINHWANKATMDIIGVAGLGKDFNAIKNPEDELIKTYEEILEPTTEKAFYFAFNVLLGRRFVSMLPWALNKSLKTTTDKLKKYCLDLIREKKQNVKAGEQSVDILSLLIKSNNFSDENLVDQLLTFLAAGHETTSSAFTWATYLVAIHPEIQKRLREEIRHNLPSPNAPLDPKIDIASILEALPLLNAVSNEVLRLYPTVPVTLRVAIRPTSIGSQHIPKGSRIYISPWAINRSLTLWGPEAEKFTPERWIDAETNKPNNTGGVTSNYCNMTFLHGPRSCIGERFAKSELRTLIAVFVGSFDLSMADPNEVPEPAGAITTKPKNGMRLKLKVLEGW